jgi:hypothetical protein
VPTETFTVTAPGGQRFNPFTSQTSGLQYFVFPSPQSSLVIQNQSLSFITIWVDRYDSAGHYQANVAHSGIVPGGQISVPWTATDARWAGIGINGDSLPAGHFTVGVNYADVVHCAYGTQKQPLADVTYWVTPALVLGWLTTVGAPELFPIFAIAYGTTVNANTLCAAPPPALPAIDLSLLYAPPEVIGQLLQAIAWPNLCQCVPGTPAPIPYPPPPVVVPPGWPTAPTFPCDPTNLCDALQRLTQLLNAIGRTVSEDYSIDTLSQRYGTPFAYIRGTRHRSLTGTASLTPVASRIIGFLVEVTAHPADNQQYLGVPPYIVDLGWVSILTGDGFIDEIRLTRTAQVWTSKLAPLATVIGYGLREGVQADITELLAEP